MTQEAQTQRKKSHEHVQFAVESERQLLPVGTRVVIKQSEATVGGSVEVGVAGQSFCWWRTRLHNGKEKEMLVRVWEVHGHLAWVP